MASHDTSHQPAEADLCWALMAGVQAKARQAFLYAPVGALSAATVPYCVYCPTGVAS